MKTHINVVGLIDVIRGAFFTALAVLVPVGVLLASWFYGAPLWRARGAVAIYAVMLLVSAVFLATGIPSLIAGIGLLRHKSWARVVAIIVAILAAPSFPVGTTAGLYTLWVLTQKETRQLLSATA